MVIVILFNNYNKETFSQTENIIDAIIQINNYVKHLNNDTFLEINKPIEFTNFEINKYVKLDPTDVNIMVDSFNINNNIKLNNNTTNGIKLNNINLYQRIENDIESTTIIDTMSFNINNNDKLLLTTTETTNNPDSEEIIQTESNPNDFSCNHRIIDKNKINIKTKKFTISGNTLNIKTKNTPDYVVKSGYNQNDIDNCSSLSESKKIPNRRNIVLNTNNIKLNNKIIEPFYEGSICGYIVHENYNNITSNSNSDENNGIIINDINSVTINNVNIPPGWVLCNRSMWILKSKYYSTAPTKGLVISENAPEECEEYYWEYEANADYDETIVQEYNYKLSQKKHCIKINDNDILLPEAISIEITDEEYKTISKSIPDPALIASSIVIGVATTVILGAVFFPIGILFAVGGSIWAAVNSEKGDCNVNIPDKLKLSVKYDDYRRIVIPKENYENYQWYSYYWRKIQNNTNIDPFTDEFLKYYMFVPNENRSYGFKHETDNINLHSFESGTMSSSSRQFLNAPYIMKY